MSSQTVTTSDKERLRECEKIVMESFEEFVKVGVALKEIRDDKLYLAEGWESFPEYTKQKWNWTAGHCHEIITSAQIRLQIPAPRARGVPGWTEFSVRQLKRLPGHAKVKTVAKKVCALVEKKRVPLTSSMVRQFVDDELGIKKPKPKKHQPPEEPALVDIVEQWVGRLSAISDQIDSLPDDALKIFVEEEGYRAKRLAEVIERVEKRLERIWAALP